MILELEHLQPATREWLQRLFRREKLQSHERRLLLHAAEAWDRSNAARLIIAKEGMVFIDRYNQVKPRPEVAIELAAKSLFYRILRAFRFDQPDED